MTLLALAVGDLPAVNASLNALATLLLLVGYFLIKRRRERAHQWTMLTAFGVSVLFLACYVAYHVQTDIIRRFTGPSYWATPYKVMLVSHIILAATIPFLALVTIWLGWTDRRMSHRRVARWTFPIWLYVSITGVLIYLVLYQLYPA